MSKGSKSRISNQKTFNEGWDRIFNKRGNNMSDKEFIADESRTYDEVVNDLGGMSVDEFLDKCEEHGIKDIVQNVDNAIDEIAQMESC